MMLPQQLHKPVGLPALSQCRVARCLVSKDVVRGDWR
jgi:hypothetical protein